MVREIIWKRQISQFLTITLFHSGPSPPVRELMKAMFSSYNDSGKGFQIDLDVGNFHIRKAGASGGNIVLSAAQLEVWTFIAFTYDGTNSIGYINSVSDNESTGGTTEFNRFRIGKNRNGNTYFTGAIDELRIYNRALTASEISSLYAN